MNSGSPSKLAMLKSVSNGVQRNPYLRFRSLILYSTASKSPEDQPTHFIVRYLEDSLGFSRESAVAASKKVSRLKSPENPNSVIDCFRQLGISQSQIKSIFLRNISLLSVSTETLAPKIRVFQDLGLSGSELGTIFASNPSILTRRLDTHINPMVEILRSILGSDENVAKVIKRSFLLITTNVPKRMLGNLRLLKSYGLSDERIRKLVLNNPNCLAWRPGKLELSMETVETKIGIHRSSQMFIHGIDVIASSSKQNIELKFRIFKSYGWTQEEITTMAKILPHSLKLSELKIKSGLDLFMKELSYEPGYLASRPKLLMFSMEKRVLPRKALWEALKEKKLVKTKPSFYSVLSVSDLCFLKNYVLPYKNELPELCEAYIKKASFSSSNAIV